MLGAACSVCCSLEKVLVDSRVPSFNFKVTQERLDGDKVRVSCCGHNKKSVKVIAVDSQLVVSSGVITNGDGCSDQKEEKTCDGGQTLPYLNQNVVKNRLEIDDNRSFDWLPRRRGY